VNLSNVLLYQTSTKFVEWNIRFPFGHENHGMWLNKLQRPQVSDSRSYLGTELIKALM
jgi:hypothetical protein